MCLYALHWPIVDAMYDNNAIERIFTWSSEMLFLERFFSSIELAKEKFLYEVLNLTRMTVSNYSSIYHSSINYADVAMSYCVRFWNCVHVWIR